MTANGGRRPMRRDATMRYIERQNLFEAVALQCGLTVHAVKCWKQVPEKNVLNVERAIGRPRRLIRPDIFKIQESA
jgi:hypothetical protein